VADEKDDLLDPAEIEALLRSAGSSQAGSEPDAASGSTSAVGSTAASNGGGSGAGNNLLGADEIEALLRSAREGGGGSTGDSPRSAGSSADDLVRKAQAGIAAALAPEPRAPRASPAMLAGAKAFQFEQFEPVSRDAAGMQIKALEEVELDLRIELGRAELLIEEVLKLREGSVVPLDKLAGDPVDILVNGRLVARGEVLVLNDNFCVRVAEILTPGVT
jgi:flagellar motor switch protein FliN/FliY